VDIQGTWKHLVTENPMTAEIGRFRRRYFSFHGPSTAVNGGLGILLVGYAIFAYFCIHYRGDIEPTGTLYIYLVFALFTVPLLLHATISGERERRSWDMLLVAPLTHGQIIFGKFIGAFLGLLFTFGIFLVPVLLCAVFYEGLIWGNFLSALAIVIGQVSSVIALTILISARVKRPLTALGVTLGVIVIYFLFLPSIIAAMSGPFSNTMLVSTSPFGLISLLSNPYYRENGYARGLDNSLLVVTNVIFETILTAVLLGWAVKTLVYADNEVKFLPKTKNNA
jgi:ABC-type transport system involved in multi-copper enzyme maturation permease subunit